MSITSFCSWYSFMAASLGFCRCDSLRLFSHSSCQRLRASNSAFLLLSWIAAKASLCFSMRMSQLFWCSSRSRWRCSLCCCSAAAAASSLRSRTFKHSSLHIISRSRIFGPAALLPVCLFFTLLLFCSLPPLIKIVSPFSTMTPNFHSDKARPKFANSSKDASASAETMVKESSCVFGMETPPTETQPRSLEPERGIPGLLLSFFAAELTSSIADWISFSLSRSAILALRSHAARNATLVF
mmetsp:Transcript_31959/g.44303  ORF Transcript_31959/g.44303 Transcript_31959/m.44303 type:complete len:241 (+) Transcript_31959:850-1572(+)